MRIYGFHQWKMSLLIKSAKTIEQISCTVYWLNQWNSSHLKWLIKTFKDFTHLIEVDSLTSYDWNFTLFRYLLKNLQRSNFVVIELWFNSFNNLSTIGNSGPSSSALDYSGFIEDNCKLCKNWPVFQFLFP